MNPLAKKFARSECEIHSQMNHQNVVKLFDCAENSKEYLLFMEYCDKGTHLSEKINDVRQLEVIYFL